MKRFLIVLLVLMALGLCAVCAVQWQREFRLRERIEAITASAGVPVATPTPSSLYRDALLSS